MPRPRVFLGDRMEHLRNAILAAYVGGGLYSVYEYDRCGISQADFPIIVRLTAGQVRAFGDRYRWSESDAAAWFVANGIPAMIDPTGLEDPRREQDVIALSGEVEAARLRGELASMGVIAQRLARIHNDLGYLSTTMLRLRTENDALVVKMRWC